MSNPWEMSPQSALPPRSEAVCIPKRTEWEIRGHFFGCPVRPAQTSYPAAGIVRFCPEKPKLPACAAVPFPIAPSTSPTGRPYTQLDRIGHFFRRCPARTAKSPAHRRSRQRPQIRQNWTLLDTFSDDVPPGQPALQHSGDLARDPKLDRIGHFWTLFQTMSRPDSQASSTPAIWPEAPN